MSEVPIELSPPRRENGEDIAQLIKIIYYEGEGANFSCGYVGKKT